MRRLIKPRTILLGGLAVAAVAGALKNRDKVAGLIGARSSAPEPWAPSTPAPSPPPAAADLPRDPVGSPAPPVTEPAAEAAPAIDERAEEEAAAAEAAAIGGVSPSYASPEADREATEAERPVIEAGGGESEGGEQAEADFRANVETGAGEPSAGYRRIAGAIQAEDEPDAWIEVEPLTPPSDPRPADELEAEAVMEPEAESLAQPETEASAPADEQTIAEPEAETIAEPEAETAAEPVAEAEAAAEPEAETTVEPRAEAAAEPEPEVETPAESDADSIVNTPSWGERFRARVRERDEAKSREPGDESPEAAAGQTSEETPEAATEEPPGQTPEAAAPKTSAEEKSSAVWRSSETGEEAKAEPEEQGSLLAPDEQPTVEADALAEESAEVRPRGADDEPIVEAPSSDDDDEGSEWQTWSGRAIEP